MSIKHALLFVCAGNTCRSPAAARFLAACLVQKGEDPLDWQIDSAGLHAVSGQPASVKMAAVLARRGLDLRMHRSTLAEDFAVSFYPLVLAMDAGLRQGLLARFPDLEGKIYLLGEMSQGGDVKDPFGADDQVYEQTAGQIEMYIWQGFSRIAELSVL